jgi:tRNA(adenine34) deaminase
MKEALKEAQKAYDADEVPVGAIVVAENKIIARSHNLTERLNDVTAHAEMQAITSAANYLGGKYLTECTLYVTLEPCVMCANLLHPKTEIISGILENECSEIIKQFFKAKR